MAVAALIVIGLVLDVASLVCDGGCSISLLANSYIRTFLLTRGNALDALGAVRMTTPVSASAGIPGTYQFYTEKTNDIWAGYAADVRGTINSVHEVHGEFTASPSSGPLGAWIGIGGYNTGNLIQTGIDESNMQAWYELLPNPPEYMFSVAAGHHIISIVSYDGDGGTWLTFIEDVESGTYFGDEWSYNTDQTTADWVLEVPRSNAVPDHSTAQFIEAEWFDQSQAQQNITSGEANQVIRFKVNDPYGGVNGGVVSASDVGQDGRSFTVG